MTGLNVVSLLLALLSAVNIGCGVGLLSRRSGRNLYEAALAGVSACGTAVALFLAAVAAYR
ncbi:hypothetical protein [Streptomyces sp. NPDC046197]|uniref:hypothetical protein n=1 Tax=Streptomyces sp. NPDC046197 TaxID=3154337 RepID=UPI0033DACB74